jgi:hypothetical protein
MKRHTRGCAYDNEVNKAYDEIPKEVKTCR